MGSWYLNLTNGRRDASTQITQQVATLTASARTPLDKMRALAQFVQHDVPLRRNRTRHRRLAASYRFRRVRAPLWRLQGQSYALSSMLSQVGVESFYVVINSERGSITPQVPANVGGFNHVILRH